MRHLSGVARHTVPRVRRRLALAVHVAIGVAACVVPGPARAQAPLASPRLEVGDAGPGRAGRLLRAVLARPHLALAPAEPAIVLPRDTTFDRSVVVVGADLYLESVVHGDVVVVGGDLFLRPGAAVQGRAVAYGGGVYFSLLARVDGSADAFRDVGFAPVARDGMLVLDYRRLRAESARAVELPGIYGLRVPSYTRVDGLAVTVGPTITLGSGTVELDPTVTYRSHLGALDPALRASYQGAAPLRLELDAARGTFTNDAWMRGDLVNSAAVLVFGDDARNYYRATRGELRATVDLGRGAGYLTPGLGALTERASSLGPAEEVRSAPWSLWGRDGRSRMRRPNPPVTGGWITSVLASLGGGWEDERIEAALSTRLELPVAVSAGGRFVQATLDATLGFATIGSQRFTARGHLVATAGDDTPAQRFAYLGGGATLPTMDELGQGGDQLLFMEGVYAVPLRWPALPLLGTPTVGARYAVGAAGIGSLPSLTQNVGLRVQLDLLHLDVMVDPATGDRAIAVGTSVFR